MPIVVNSADILCQMSMVCDIGFEIEFLITANDSYLSGDKYWASHKPYAIDFSGL